MGSVHRLWGWCFTNTIVKPPSSPSSSSSSKLPRALPPVRCVPSGNHDVVLETFLRDRDLNADFISKVSDILCTTNYSTLHPNNTNNSQQSQQSQQQQQQQQPQPDRALMADDNSGFLKLSTTQDWLLGDNIAPYNNKPIPKPFEYDREARKRLSLLQYEALKKEVWVLSIAIGTACTLYCFIVLSLQAGVSYAIGVALSCLYLQLLYKHADEVCADRVPSIFRQKKTHKIGIRSSDLEGAVEKWIRGSGMALSSPRLVIPAAIYAMWIVCHRFQVFDFQIVPAMFGLFAYKAAALVQLYRDNQDLQLVFPDDNEPFQ